MGTKYNFTGLEKVSPYEVGVTGFAGWLRWNYCSPIEDGIYARYTNNYGRSDIVASGDYYDPYVKNLKEDD